MAVGLLNIVMPSQFFPNGTQTEEMFENYCWELLYKERDVKDVNPLVNMKFEVEGVKANIVKEKQLDRKYYCFK